MGDDWWDVEEDEEECEPDDSALFDADELGLDPEDDNRRLYGEEE